MFSETSRMNYGGVGNRGIPDVAAIRNALSDAKALHDKADTTASAIAYDTIDDVCTVTVMSGDDKQHQLRHDIRLVGKDRFITDLDSGAQISRCEPYEHIRLYIPRRLYDGTIGQIETMAIRRRKTNDPLWNMFVVYLGKYASSLSTLSASEAEIGLTGC